MAAVPYNGGPPAVLDLMANRVQFMVVQPGLVAQHIDTGALKVLAVVGTTRSPHLPNVPTMSEAGYPETNVVAWFGYGAPRGTPRPVIDNIVAGFNEVMQIASVRELYIQTRGVMTACGHTGDDGRRSARPVTGGGHLPCRRSEWDGSF